MRVEDLKNKVGKCEYELAFAEKNGSVKRIARAYVSEARKLIILCSPLSSTEDAENDGNE